MKPAITLFGSYRPQPGDEQYALAESIGYQLAAAGFDLLGWPMAKPWGSDCDAEGFRLPEADSPMIGPGSIAIQ